MRHVMAELLNKVNIFGRRPGINHIQQIAKVTNSTVEIRLVKRHQSTVIRALKPIMPEKTGFICGNDLFKSSSAEEVYKKISKTNVIDAVQQFLEARPFGPREVHCLALNKLLEEGLDPNGVDADGNTALHLLANYKVREEGNRYSSYHADQTMTYLLLESGANPHLVNQEMKTPAHLCFESLDNAPYRNPTPKSDVRENILYQLLSRMQRFDTVDQYGWGLLHHAVYKQHPNLVRELLLEGINPNQATHNSITPFHLAVYRRNKAMCDALSEHGATFPEDIPLHPSILQSNKPLVDMVHPSYFSKMAMQLRQPHWKYDPHYHGTFYQYTNPCHRMTGIFSPSDIDETSETKNITHESEAFLELYQPIKGETPMSTAIASGNLDKIQSLIDKGWNAYIENDFLIQYHQTSVGAFYHALDNLFKSLGGLSKKGFCEIIKLFATLPTTGVSPETEFERLVFTDNYRRGFNENQAINLLDMGITPASFEKATGVSFKRAIGTLELFDGDRDRAYHLDFKRSLEARFHITDENENSLSSVRPRG